MSAITQESRVKKKTRISASTEGERGGSAKSKGKSRAGKLEGLMLMPMDILFEHASMCHDWFEEQKTDRSAELEQARHDRRNS
ncbi:hypothetical protein HWV62_1893 [Athelia sp. TMB]|nr:hypothetical protein HWV62_38426 [Athelia sp. TMB]KAF7978021.1 hypothetical protein HWV62_1893 [Athelia sp. TMB]